MVYHNAYGKGDAASSSMVWNIHWECPNLIVGGLALGPVGGRPKLLNCRNRRRRLARTANDKDIQDNKNIHEYKLKKKYESQGSFALLWDGRVIRGQRHVHHLQDFSGILVYRFLTLTMNASSDAHPSFTASFTSGNYRNYRN